MLALIAINIIAIVGTILYIYCVNNHDSMNMPGLRFMLQLSIQKDYLPPEITFPR